MAPRMPRYEDEPIRPTPEGETAPGLEGVLRMDMGALEASQPSLVDQAIRGPVVLTRNGADAFVLLPLDVYRRFWNAVRRPPVIDSE